MPTRRPVLNRIAVWTAAAILLLVGYLASAPFVAKWCDQHFPAAIPVVRVVWMPIWTLIEHSEWPGSRTYRDYYSWSQRKMKMPIDARAILRRSTDLEFNDTALRDVLTYASEIHDCRIEFAGTVDDTRRVAIHTSATLAEALEELFQPHGLIAVPVGEGIVIGPPEVVQQMAKDFDRQQLIGNSLVLGILLLCLALAVWFIRRRVSRHHSADSTTPL